ncbi:MAG: tetratricopeptide repeat protein [Rhodospirillaceae bacterium]
MNTLQQAFSHHQSGDLPSAVRLYRDFLQTRPDHADALHLLGIALTQSGRGDEACEALTRAVELNPQNPDYLNNLGLLLYYRRDYDEARARLEAALAISPDSADALNNLGMTLQKLNKTAEAVECFTRSLEFDPSNWETLHNLGGAYQAAGRLEDARRAFLESLRLNADNVNGLTNLAMIQFALNDPAQGFDCCWKAIRKQPDFFDAHKLFYDMRVAGQGGEDAFESFRWACDAHPDKASVHRQFGDIYAFLDRFAEAEPWLRKAVEIAPDDINCLSSLGWYCANIGKHDEAGRLLAKAAAMEPDDPQIRHRYGQALLQGGRFADAVGQLEIAHNLRPRINGILADMITAMHETDDPRLADWLDYDRDVVPRLVDVPAGYGSLGDFNEALHAELEPRHGDKAAPSDQSLRGGTQIPGNILEDASLVIRAARDAIAGAIASYLSELTEDKSHPFRRYLNRDFRFTGSWSTILYGAGYDMSHIHTDAWLSGVYYVKVPDLPENLWESGEGCIQFGEPPEEYVSEKNRKRRIIRPQPGMVVPFPSYVWHGVLPFTREGLRHAIAFDVV